MTELENVGMEMDSVEDLGALFGMGDDEAELEKMFAADVASIEEEAKMSNDLDGFAKGFPSWDVVPPEKDK